MRTPPRGDRARRIRRIRWVRRARRIGHGRHPGRGQAWGHVAVETVLVVPVLLLTLFALADLALFGLNVMAGNHAFERALERTRLSAAAQADPQRLRQSFESAMLGESYGWLTPADLQVQVRDLSVSTKPTPADAPGPERSPADAPVLEVSVRQRLNWFTPVSAWLGPSSRTLRNSFVPEHASLP